MRDIKTNHPTAEQIPTLKKLWHEAFGDDYGFINKFFDTAYSAERAMCVTADGECVAALYWFDCECGKSKTAYIYAVATAEKYRSMGLCKKLMEHTHKHLLRDGYKTAVLVPGESTLFDFYAKLGYETFGYINEQKYFKGTQKINIKKADANEYAKIRKIHLPEGGIVQENENLDFLANDSFFLYGSDFVVAAREESGTFFGIEFLGNTEKIPSLLNTLGYDSAVVRTVGKSRKFAMCYKLSDGDMPKYFGLAFD